MPCSGLRMLTAVSAVAVARRRQRALNNARSVSSAYAAAALHSAMPMPNGVAFTESPADIFEQIFYA